MKLKVDIGIGSVTTDFSTLHLSTEEAFRALLFLKHQNHEPGVYLANSHSDLNKTAEEQHPPIRALYYFHRMAQTLLIDQKADALADVEQFISILSSRSFTNQQLRSLATEFWSVIGFTFYTTSPNKGNGFEEAFRDTHIETIDSLGQLCNWMCNLVTMVSDSRSVNGNLKHNPAVEVMLQHIHEHYYEEFTLEDLSAKLYLTPNYLSRIFKQATGETFNIYLVRVRIEKAKALLLEGKLMIYEIATKVGYKNIPYFSSLFKKFTGVNPREFAKLGR